MPEPKRKLQVATAAQIAEGNDVPEYVGPPPEEICEQLRRYAEVGSNGQPANTVALTLLLGKLRDEGYRVDVLAEVCGLSIPAMYSRLRTYKRYQDGEEVRGFPPRESVPFLEREDAQALFAVYKRQQHKPSKRESFASYEAWLDARRLLEERLFNLMQDGFTVADLARETGIPPVAIGQRVSFYRETRL